MTNTKRTSVGATGERHWAVVDNVCKSGTSIPPPPLEFYEVVMPARGRSRTDDHVVKPEPFLYSRCFVAMVARGVTSSWATRPTVAACMSPLHEKFLLTVFFFLFITDAFIVLNLFYFL